MGTKNKKETRSIDPVGILNKKFDPMTTLIFSMIGMSRDPVVCL